MRTTIGRLRRIIREALGEIDLNEVDTDPSNNPGRPSDAYEYIGMHPPAGAAMAHPGTTTGSGGSSASASSSSEVLSEPEE